MLIALYRKACIANLHQLALASGLTVSSFNYNSYALGMTNPFVSPSPRISWLSTDLADQLSAPSVVGFQYNDTALDRYYLVASVFTGALSSGSSSVPPELQFFIVSTKLRLFLYFQVKPNLCCGGCRLDTNNKWTYKNIFQILMKANQVTEFPPVDPRSFVEMLQVNSLAAMTLPSFLPKVNLKSSLTSPGGRKPTSPVDLASGVLGGLSFTSSPNVTPNGTSPSTSATPLEGSASVSLRKRKRSEEDSLLASPAGDGTTIPDAKRLKMSTDSRPSPIESPLPTPSPGGVYSSSIPSLSPAGGVVVPDLDGDLLPDGMDQDYFVYEGKLVDTPVSEEGDYDDGNEFDRQTRKFLLRPRQFQFSAMVSACKYDAHEFTFYNFDNICGCRAKLCKLLLQEELAMHKIEHKRAPQVLPFHPTNVPSILMSINCDPLMVNQCILSVLPNSSWMVRFGLVWLNSIPSDFHSFFPPYLLSP